MIIDLILNHPTQYASLTDLISQGYVERIPLPDHPSRLAEGYYRVTGGFLHITFNVHNIMAVQGLIPDSIHLLKQGYVNNLKTGFDIGCMLYEMRAQGVRNLTPNAVKEPTIIEAIKLHRERHGQDTSFHDLEITNRLINSISHTD